MIAPGTAGTVIGPDNLKGSRVHERWYRKEPCSPAMVCIGMGHDNTGECCQIPDSILREHRHDCIMVDAVAGIDHYGIAGCGETEYAPSAGWLKTMEGNHGGDGELLHIRVKTGPVCPVHTPPGLQHTFKSLVGIASPVHQFLCHMVGICKEGEEELFFRIANKFPHCLRKADIEHRIIKVLSGLVIFQDLEPVPGFQLVEEFLYNSTLLKVQAYGEPVGMPAFIVKIDEGDVCTG